MKLIEILGRLASTLVFALVALPSLAADYPAPKEGTWVVRDFRFHTGEALPELRLHYTTVGAPGGEPVLILHGTTGSGTGMLAPTFAGELFGPGQPLDASRYYIILPDATRRATTTRRPVWSAFGRRCWRSTRRTTSATPRSSGRSTGRSSA